MTKLITEAEALLAHIRLARKLEGLSTTADKEHELCRAEKAAYETLRQLRRLTSTYS